MKIHRRWRESGFRNYCSHKVLSLSYSQTLTTRRVGLPPVFQMPPASVLSVAWSPCTRKLICSNSEWWKQQQCDSFLVLFKLTLASILATTWCTWMRPTGKKRHYVWGERPGTIGYWFLLLPTAAYSASESDWPHCPKYYSVCAGPQGLIREVGEQ